MKFGNHSNTHPHVNNLTYEKNIQQINECNDKIKKLTQTEVKLYRCPYGEYNNTVLTACKDSGFYAIQWNIDTLDYEGLTGDEMWKRLEPKLANGSIILSHNGTKNTANSLDMLLRNIKNKGYEIVKVSDLIYKDSYSINNNGTQISNNE